MIFIVFSDIVVVVVNSDFGERGGGCIVSVRVITIQISGGVRGEIKSKSESESVRVSVSSVRVMWSVSESEVVMCDSSRGSWS